MTRELLQQALHALDLAVCVSYSKRCTEQFTAAINALRAALAAEQPEPTAIVCESPQSLNISGGAIVRWAAPLTDALPPGTKLYAAPPAAPSVVNLTDPAVQKRLATQWGYVPAAPSDKEAGNGKS